MAITFAVSKVARAAGDDELEHAHWMGSLSGETVEEEAIEASRIPMGVALVAGRLSGPCELSVHEAGALRAQIIAAGAERGVRIACALAGDTSHVGMFPEAPIACRFAVGVEVGSVESSTRRWLTLDELRGAVDAAGALPEETWRALGDLVPGGLDGAPALHLVVAGAKMAGAIEYELVDGDVAIPVALVGGEEATHATADVTPAKHMARVVEGATRGGAGGTWRYLLKPQSPWERRRR